MIEWSAYRYWVLSIAEPANIDVSLTSPKNGAFVFGNVSIEAAVNPAGAAGKVDFYGDSVLLGSDATAPYRVKWDTSTFAKGKHILTARVFDSAGKQKTSAPVSITVIRCPDFDGDGVVSIGDILMLIQHFGQRAGSAGWDQKFDLDGDGAVSIGDIVLAVNNFGKSCQ